MYCICCKKNNVNPFDNHGIRRGGRSKGTQPEEDLIWKKEKRKDGSLVNVNNEMINNGIIHIIDAGYGSTHDGDQIILAICDDCIKENLEDATLLYYGNYMYPNENFIVEDVEKSKQKYRRRNNLDNLI
jgi:hypothetical protein